MALLTAADVEACPDSASRYWYLRQGLFCCHGGKNTCSCNFAWETHLSFLCDGGDTLSKQRHILQKSESEKLEDSPRILSNSHMPDA